MLSELLQLAVGNLSRARTRFLMTAGGVLVGTTAVIMLVAVTFGLQRSAEASIGSSTSLTQVEVYQAWGMRGSNEEVPQLTVAAVRAFWQIPGVQAVIPFASLQNGGELIVGDYRGWGEVLGIDPSLLPYMGFQLQQGQLSLGPGEVIVGSQVSQNFYDPEASSEEWSPVQVDLMASPVQLSIYKYTDTTFDTKEIDLKVAGMMAEGTSYDYAILMNIQDVMALNKWATGEEVDAEKFTFSRVMVQASSRDTVGDVSKAIQAMGYGVGGVGDYLDQLNSFFQTMRLALGGVGFVALVVAAFGVFNTMSMAVLERTKEIGLMKAIGATDRDVLTVFMVESALVGLCGGTAGVLLSLGLQNLVNNLFQTPAEGQASGVTAFLPFDTSQLGGNLIVIPTELILLGIALATLIGTVAGFIPARRAFRMLPVSALKEE
ncbi:MAG TPA: ABC transporter permease [Aggregatilinea sp.]|jgi:putative ABC transport system permease protein|uniref:ABC transporter permease n=1 Tax=Aggregatilinea sp. TaxID=2806333 RepID=UPI002BCFE318|nr:ABC transporter permease [Aggregatilinea sp.]HML20584.1 ABC transporter permease [Aggregatilinea sp.]